MSAMGLSKRTLKHYLKHEMAAPAGAIRELGLLLLADAKDAGYMEFLADTETMCDSAKKLVDLVGTGLTPAKLEAAMRSAGADLFFEIRTLVNQVQSYCTLLLKEARGKEMFVRPLVLMLEVIHKHCAEITSSVVRLEQFGRGKSPSPDSAKIPVIRPPRHRGRLLVVDGNGGNALVRRLERQGHAVTVAQAGTKALEVLATADVDVILLDQKLPDMDGADLLKHLKTDEKLHHVPVIMVSDLDERHSAIEYIQLGAEDYLSKQVDQVLLLARIGACLERWRLKDREYEQFFPPEIVQQLRYRRDLLARRELNVTVLFCDIRGFSRISERLGHVKTVEWVSDVMDRLSTCVIEHQGVLVDFIGDELMALWGAPEPQDDAEKLACKAALDMLNQLPDLNSKWQGRLREAMDLGIGIHTGMAHVGNVGSSRRFKYGTLGGTVNLASRVQGATKHLRSRLLITQATRAALPNAFALRRLGKVRVVNIPRPVEVYELSSSDRPGWSDLKVAYEKALGEFERQNFSTAIRLLGNLLEDYPDDGPLDLLLSRAVSLKQNPPNVFDEVLLDLVSK